MKHRQLKKLCKKAVPLLWRLSFTTKFTIIFEYLVFDKDEGLWIYMYNNSCECEEWDHVNAWSVLENAYIDQHTDYSQSEPVFVGKKATPSRVIQWANTPCR